MKDEKDDSQGFVIEPDGFEDDPAHPRDKRVVPDGFEDDEIKFPSLWDTPV